MELAVIDFETEAIVGNPVVNPPRSVGCSIWMPGDDPIYYSWGSPHDDNNIKYGDFHQYLERILESRIPLLFHNAAFDISVWNADFCNAFLNLKQEWKRIHDTLFLVFLMDPYSSTFSLKPSADRYLGMAPDEQTVLYDWIMANIPECTSRREAGGFISRAPVSLVGPYAVGDVIRTRGLFDYLHGEIVEKGMEAAYDRERELLPILLSGTQRGIRIDRSLLEYHTEVYTDCEREACNRLSNLVGVDLSGDVSDEQLANAFEACGAVTDWVITPTGKRSMAKGNIRIIRPDVRELYEYRARLQTCLQTFMRPWLAKSASDGRLHPNWNQVRQSRGETNFSKGARTGRLSSDDPNFQNVPTEFVDQAGNPIVAPDGLHPLPQLRAYCLPEDGHVWVKRDFSSQEIRIVAHFEDGSLLEAYRGNPLLDPHAMAKELILGMIGVQYARKSIKITSFSIIYGSGAPGLSSQLGASIEEARSIKSAYLDAMPGIRDLMYDVSARGRRGEEVRTWGGRLYSAEPAKIVNGQWRDFAYKLLNYLVQGSAADQTKQSIIDWDNSRHWSDVFLATVHDEINISVPADRVPQGMSILRKAMDADRFDVPMRSEGFTGPNWQQIEEWDDTMGMTKPPVLREPAIQLDDRITGASQPGGRSSGLKIKGNM